MADFPTRWRLVLLSGEERIIELRRDVHDRWVGVVEIEGRLRLTSPQSTPYAALNWSVARFEMYRELTPATEPRRAELVAALRSHLVAEDLYNVLTRRALGANPLRWPGDGEREAAYGEADKTRNALRDLLARCP